MCRAQEGQTYAFGINNLCFVVGRAVLANGQIVGFIRRSNGVIATFSILGSNLTQAYGYDWGRPSELTRIRPAFATVSCLILPAKSKRLTRRNLLHNGTRHQ